jgi:hypothetical protein
MDPTPLRDITVITNDEAVLAWLLRTGSFDAVLVNGLRA